MTTLIGMHESSLAHIGGGLGALGLDVEVVTFNNDGVFSGGRAADEMSLDYLWLSMHVPREMGQDRAFDMALACKRIDVFQSYNAGIEHPFFKKAAARGIRICNSSAQGVAIAEYVFGQVLAELHPIADQRRLQADRNWTVLPFREIAQQTWTVLGYGPIGRRVALRAKAFEAQVQIMRRQAGAVDGMNRVGSEIDLPDMLATSDVVVIACPLTDRTRGLAGATFFRALKPGAIIVNIARGQVIDDDALRAALDDGTVATAILDVFDQEPLPADSWFWDHPGVRVTAHSSFNGDGTQLRWDQLFLDNIGRYVRGEELLREVDPATL